MTRCGECGQPVHPHQMTCGSCGVSLRPDRAEDRDPRSTPPASGPAEDADAGGREEPPGDAGAGEVTDARAATAPTGPEVSSPKDAVRPTEEPIGASPLSPEPPPERDSVTAHAPLIEDETPVPPSTPAAGSAPSPGAARPRRRRRVRPRKGPESSPAFLSRTWALIVDLVLLFVASSTLPFFARMGIRAAEAVSGTTELYDDVLIRQLTTVGDIALVASYFTFVTAATGQTVGKGLMGLRVVRTDGRPLDPLQSLIRVVGYVFSLMPVGVGFLLAAFPPRRGLHDYLAGTIVVRPRDMPLAESETGPR